MPGKKNDMLSPDDLEDYDGDLEKLPTEEVPLEATQIGTPIAVMPRAFGPGVDPGGTTIVPVGEGAVGVTPRPVARRRSLIDKK